jgi:hypothetical protein
MVFIDTLGTGGHYYNQVPAHPKKTTSEWRGPLKGIVQPLKRGLMGGINR